MIPWLCTYRLILTLDAVEATQARLFPLRYTRWTSREKLVMHTLTRFTFTLAQLLVSGYMFGAWVPVAHGQVQQQVAPSPPPAAPVTNPPSPNGAVPQLAPVSPEAPSAAVGSNIASPEARSAARTHKRKSVAKMVRHRGRSMVAGWTPSFYWRRYWDPRVPCYCWPIWNPYGPDYGGGWLMSRF